MERFLTLAEVERVTSLKKSKLYELIRAGAFPHQREVTARRRAWLASDVEMWIKRRAGADTASRHPIDELVRTGAAS
jgi:prophage regulatory protein